MQACQFDVVDNASAGDFSIHATSFLATFSESDITTTFFLQYKFTALLHLALKVTKVLHSWYQLCLDVKQFYKITLCAFARTSVIASTGHNLGQYETNFALSGSMRDKFFRVSISQT